MQKKLIPDIDYRVPSACGVTGIMNQKGELFSGDAIYASICNMLERGSGLGSGFVAYGIYPELKDYWCFHIMYQDDRAKENTEDYLKKNFGVKHSEPIPTRRVKSLKFIPLLWRYFLEIEKEVGSAEDYIIKVVMDINKEIEGAFVFSSGKNMGIFKGVGNPDEIGEFFRVPEYKGYIWVSHNRFPTNSVGWWGGAHPFGILDWSVVHNGEISSYGVNKRYLENFGYFCTLSTDTEVITYLFDLLVRRHKIPFETVGNILSAPFWSQIERIEDKEERELLKTLRMVYGPALVNGPFSVIVANSSCMVGLNDRIKLRPLVAATKGDFLYISSEEAAIKIVSPQLDKVWMPRAGEPTIGKLM
ncbi:MAG: glutamine amidotransferase family protein [Caldiserica bacterium]|nr:glutamine amidotransferase family protein [Caldisericota bacterium]